MMRPQPLARSTDDYGEDGVALVLTIVLMLVAATVGGSLMLLSQTETYASYNYKLMTQARYAAESGIHRAVHHFLDSTAYTPPAANTVASTFVNTGPKVTWGGQTVRLSARPGVTSNHPNTATQTAFNAAAQGTLMAGTTPVQYAASADLLSIRVVQDYGANTQTVIESWEIHSEGTVQGSRPATVEVSAVLERHVIMVSMFGLFATGQTCAALSLGGGVITDSYDSSALVLGPGGTPVTNPSGGNVGTNGNLTLNGTGTIVQGSLSTPRQGVGNCNTTGAALTLTGGSRVDEGIDQLPQPIVFPLPAAPNPVPPTTNVTINKTTTCANLIAAGVVTAAQCSGVNADPGGPSGGLTINPNGSTLLWGNVSMGSGCKITLSSGSYNVNSWSLSGNSTLAITGSTPVVFNVAGNPNINTPVDFTGGAFSNPSFVSSNFQLTYAGTGNIKVAGGSATSMMVYAPDATAQITGGSDFYGAFLAKNIDVSGGTRVHYDKHSPANFGTAGNFMLSSFTWKKV